MPGSEAEECLENRHGLPSAIVPKDELVQIDLQLGAAHPMVGTEEPLLEVPVATISEGHHGFRSLVQLGSQVLLARDMEKILSIPVKVLRPSGQRHVARYRWQASSSANWS